MKTSLIMTEKMLRAQLVWVIQRVIHTENMLNEIGPVVQHPLHVSG